MHFLQHRFPYSIVAFDEIVEVENYIEEMLKVIVPDMFIFARLAGENGDFDSRFCFCPEFAVRVNRMET
ncbi:unnamed protein product [Amoebophrya sp. A120]|nr:unnamed protein product [Amoebophrya sp. A120]|eukprot:GSA120T00020606001.1